MTKKDEKQNSVPAQPADVAATIPDEQKERNAHVFLAAWKIWLEARRRKPHLAPTGKEHSAEHH